MAVGGGDQRPVDGLGNVRPGQRRVEGARVAPRAGLEHVRLDVRVQRLSQRRRVALPRLPERVEHQLAVGAVAGDAVLAVGRLVETHLLAGRQRHGRKRHVRAGQHREHPLRSLPHGARARDDRLGLVRQRVRLLAQDVADVERVPGESRLPVRESHRWPPSRRAAAPARRSSSPPRTRPAARWPSPRRSCASDTRRSSSALRKANTYSRTRSFSVVLIASSASDRTAALSPSRPLEPRQSSATCFSRRALSVRQASRLS